MRAAGYLAAGALTAITMSACGGGEVVSDYDKCIARVPQDKATLRAVVEPLVEARFHDSMGYFDDCDSGEGASLSWDVSAAPKETVQTLRRAGWDPRDSENMDPTVADVSLARDVQGQTVRYFVTCMDDGECEAVADIDAD